MSKIQPAHRATSSSSQCQPWVLSGPIHHKWYAQVPGPMLHAPGPMLHGHLWGGISGAVLTCPFCSPTPPCSTCGAHCSQSGTQAIWIVHDCATSSACLSQSETYAVCGTCPRLSGVGAVSTGSSMLGWKGDTPFIWPMDWSYASHLAHRARMVYHP